MVMFRQWAVKKAIVSGCLAIMCALLVGCNPATGDFNALLDELTDSGRLLVDMVKIRIVNQSTAELHLEVSVDGMVMTMTCDGQEICETPLGNCPSEISLLSERRFDSMGTFLGGKDFHDAADFTLTQEDYDCDETVIFKFTESDTSILVL